MTWDADLKISPQENLFYDLFFLIQHFFFLVAQVMGFYVLFQYTHRSDFFFFPILAVVFLSRQNGDSIPIDLSD